MYKQVIKNIRIILVATTHPGNIGATARAMKTMGVEQLALVAPKVFPGAEATARAAGADDILVSASVYDSLQDAVTDCKLVLAASARIRSVSWPILNPEQAVEQIIQHARQGEKVAVVFGRESSGLSNDELELCNAMIRIPANPGFSSLNLASAVQIICYELRRTLLNSEINIEKTDVSAPLASSEQMRQLYEHLQQCITDMGYYDPAKPRLLMRRLKRLLNRAQLDINEYNIIRGILAASQEKAGKEKN
ncbi:MAG: RNA methyltransferase [Gammaproteobacteria bacterium]